MFTQRATPANEDGAAPGSPRNGASPLPAVKLLSGETIERTSKDGNHMLTNYALMFEKHGELRTVPCASFETVVEEGAAIKLTCKDGRIFRLDLSDETEKKTWLTALKPSQEPPGPGDSFAFKFFAANKKERPVLHQTMMKAIAWNKEEKSLMQQEFERMQFPVAEKEGAFKLIKNEELCNTYPEYLIIPSGRSEEDVQKAAQYRASNRLPVVVYRHASNGAIIARTSQPYVGWFPEINQNDKTYFRSLLASNGTKNRRKPASFTQENGHSTALAEDLVPVPEQASNKNTKLIRDASEISSISSRESVELHPLADPSEEMPDFASNRESTGQISSPNTLNVDKSKTSGNKMVFVDARPYANAIMNRLIKGGGHECADNYTNSEVFFMNMENIHKVKNVFGLLSVALDTNHNSTSWLTTLQGTSWLDYMSTLILASNTVCVHVAENERAVVVHCSDGWDRTPQITALAQLCMDPFYRTVKGFQVLVEKEWVQFGHKFGDRCGNAGATANTHGERCPIFLQWLDAVHQVMRQFPHSFEFTKTYLIKLATHIYSNLFGTFLCNSSKQRRDEKVFANTYPVWSLFEQDNLVDGCDIFVNQLYKKNPRVLKPDHNIKSLVAWSDVYKASSQENLSQFGEIVAEDGITPSGEMARTRSCEDVTAMTSGTVKRYASDSNLAESSISQGAGTFLGSCMEPIDGSLRLVKNSSSNEHIELSQFSGTSDFGNICTSVDTDVEVLESTANDESVRPPQQLKHRNFLPGGPPVSDEKDLEPPAPLHDNEEETIFHIEVGEQTLDNIGHPPPAPTLLLEPFRPFAQQEPVCRVCTSSSNYLTDSGYLAHNKGGMSTSSSMRSTPGHSRSSSLGQSDYRAMELSSNVGHTGEAFIISQHGFDRSETVLDPTQIQVQRLLSSKQKECDRLRQDLESCKQLLNSQLYHSCNSSVSDCLRSSNAFRSTTNTPTNALERPTELSVTNLVSHNFGLQHFSTYVPEASLPPAPICKDSFLEITNVDSHGKVESGIFKKRTSGDLWVPSNSIHESALTEQLREAALSAPSANSRMDAAPSLEGTQSRSNPLLDDCDDMVSSTTTVFDTYRPVQSAIQSEDKELMEEELQPKDTEASGVAMPAESERDDTLAAFQLSPATKSSVPISIASSVHRAPPTPQQNQIISSSYELVSDKVVADETYEEFDSSYPCQSSFLSENGYSWLSRGTMSRARPRNPSSSSSGARGDSDAERSRNGTSISSLDYEVLGPVKRRNSIGPSGSIDELNRVSTSIVSVDSCEQSFVDNFAHTIVSSSTSVSASTVLCSSVRAQLCSEAAIAEACTNLTPTQVCASTVN